MYNPYRLYTITTKTELLTLRVATQSQILRTVKRIFRCKMYRTYFIVLSKLFNLN